MTDTTNLDNQELPTYPAWPTVTVMINLKPFTTTALSMSYGDIVSVVKFGAPGLGDLVGDLTKHPLYTITYCHREYRWVEGSITPDESLFLLDGMVIDCVVTGNA